MDLLRPIPAKHIFLVVTIWDFQPFLTSDDTIARTWRFLRRMSDTLCDPVSQSSFWGTSRTRVCRGRFRGLKMKHMLYSKSQGHTCPNRVHRLLVAHTILYHCLTRIHTYSQSIVWPFVRVRPDYETPRFRDLKTCENIITYHKRNILHFFINPFYPNTVEKANQLPHYDWANRVQALAGGGRDAGFGNEDVEGVIAVAAQRISVIEGRFLFPK